MDLTNADHISFVMLEALHHLDSPTRFTFNFVGVGSLHSVEPQPDKMSDRITVAEKRKRITWQHFAQQCIHEPE